MARKPLMMMRKKNPITALFTKYANLNINLATPAGPKQVTVQPQTGITITVTEGTTTSGATSDPLYGYGRAGQYINTNENGFTPSGSPPLYPQSMGSRVPATAGFGGTRGIYWSAQKYAQPRFYLVVLGTRPQNSFTSVDIQGHGVVTSAGADGYGTITSGSLARTFWRWNITPTGWDGTGTSTVTIS